MNGRLSRAARPILARDQPDRAAGKITIQITPASRNRQLKSTNTPSVAESSSPERRLIPAMMTLAQVNEPPQPAQAMSRAMTARRRSRDELRTSGVVVSISSGSDIELLSHGF